MGVCIRLRLQLGLAFTALFYLIACQATPSNGLNAQSPPAIVESGSVYSATASSQSNSSAISPSALTTDQVQLRYSRKSVPWFGVRLNHHQSVTSPLKVESISPGSPAEKAGMRPADEFISFNQEPLNSAQQLRSIIQAASVNQRLSFRMKRDGQEYLQEVTLEGKPDDEDLVRLALVGRRAPELAGAITYQGELSSMREARGRVVLIDFWASYCGACLGLLQEVEQISRTYAAQGLEVIGLTVDSSRRGREIARNYHLSYTMMSDPQAEVVQRYHAQTIPMLVLVNQAGVVIDVMIGAEPKRLADLLAEAQVLLAGETK